MKHGSWIVLSGVLWLMIGVMLTYKGLSFLSEATMHAGSLCFRFQGLFGSPKQAGMALTAGALLVGFIKGRFVLSRTVNRTTSRILSLPLPMRVSSIYPKSYWILIGAMVGMGMLLRFLPVPVDVRGFIDVAVGSALLNGAGLYFRAASGS